MMGDILESFLGGIETFFDNLFKDGWIGILGIIILVIAFLYILYKVII